MTPNTPGFSEYRALVNATHPGRRSKIDPDRIGIVVPETDISNETSSETPPLEAAE